MWLLRISNSVYKIPNYAKRMHLKARKEKKIREIENPGSELALGLDRPQHNVSHVDNWRMNAGWDVSMVRIVWAKNEVMLRKR